MPRVKQTITINLILEPEQLPYSNDIESGSKDFPPYDHLKQFFEELDPAYSVESITSDLSIC